MSVTSVTRDTFTLTWTFDQPVLSNGPLVATFEAHNIALDIWEDWGSIDFSSAPPTITTQGPDVAAAYDLWRITAPTTGITFPGGLVLNSQSGVIS